MSQAEKPTTTRRRALHLIAGTAVATAAIPAMAIAETADADLIAACRHWLALDARWCAAWSDHDDAIEAGRDATVLEEIAEVIGEEKLTAHRHIVDTPATTREGLIAKATVLAAWLFEAEQELAKAEEDRSGDCVDAIGYSIARDVRTMQRGGVL